MDNIAPLTELIDMYLIHKDLDDDRMYILKQRIISLPQIDKQILLQYVETQSLRKTAKSLGCSQTTIANMLKNIKKKLC